jgi:hypothetical protein
MRSEASPHALPWSEAASPHVPVLTAQSEAAAACPASDRRAALHRLRTGKRHSAGSSPRPATTPHLSPSSLRRPHRRPSSIDHFPRRHHRHREPSPVSHFPPKGPQSCCYLIMLPSRRPRSTSSMADVGIWLDTAAPAPGTNTSLVSAWAAPAPVSWWAACRRRSCGPRRALCKRAATSLCSWAAEGFGPLAFDLLCYFLYIFK